MTWSQSKIFPRESSPWTHRIGFLGVPLCSPDDSLGGILLYSRYICAWTVCLDLMCSSTLPWFCLSCTNHLSLKEGKVISGTGCQGFPPLGRAGGKVAGPLQMPRRGGVPGSSAEQGSCQGVLWPWAQPREQPSGRYRCCLLLFACLRLPQRPQTKINNNDKNFCFKPQMHLVI